MRVVIQPFQDAIEGLGAAGGAMPLWTGPLQGSTAAAVRAAGMTPLDTDPGDGERLVVMEGTALGRNALKCALAAGRSAGRDARFRLGGWTGDLIAEVLRGRCTGLTYLQGPDPLGSGGLDARLRAAAELELDPAEQSVQVWLPEADAFAVSDRVVLPVRHWADLLWANLIGLGPALWGTLVSRSVPGSIVRLIWASIRSMSFRPEVVAARLSRRGRGATVHPTAVVEGAWLGPNVRVGAGAVVRASILGPGTVVEDLAVCEGVVSGEGALIQRQAMCKFSVLGPGARVAGAIQLAVMGPDSSIKRGAYLMDRSLAEGSAVRILLDGELGPAPLGMTGVCVGARTIIGSGVWVAPGRCLPPDLVIGKDSVLLRPDPPAEFEAGQVLVVRDGRLMPP